MHTSETWAEHRKETEFAGEMMGRWITLERVLLKMMGAHDASADELRAMAKTASRYFDNNPKSLL